MPTRTPRARRAPKIATAFIALASVAPLGPAGAQTQTIGEHQPAPPSDVSPVPTGPEHSADRASPAGVGVAALVKAALDASPDLAAMRREFDAARARVPQEKALPDPTVMLSNNTVANPVPFAGWRNDFSEVAVGFSQDLPWFGVRRLRGEAADSEAEAKLQEYAAKARRLTADVKGAAYTLHALDRKLAVLARDKDILEKFAAVAEARYSVGKAQQVDVINARIEITELVDMEGELEAQRSIEQAKLNTLLFRDPETTIGPLAKPSVVAEPPALDALIALAEENAPDLKQQRRLFDASNHRLRLAEREAKYPEVGVNFTYHNRPGFSDYYTYGVTFRLPLYSATKQRYGVEEKSSDLAAARSRLQSTDALVRYSLREAHVRATTAARLLKLHEQGLVPQAALALESSMAAYQVGQVDFLTLLTALKKALDYETRYYDLEAEYATALADMEAVTGTDLTR